MWHRLVMIISGLCRIMVVDLGLDLCVEVFP